MRNDDALRVCAECFDPEFPTEIECLSAGDESWDVCPSCRTVEGKTIYVQENSDGRYEKVDL